VSFLTKSIVDQGIVSLSNFLIIIFSANLLSPQDHGFMSLVLSTLYAVQMLNLSFLYGGSFIFLKQEGNVVNYRFILLIMCILIALSTSLVFLIIGYYVDIFTKIDILLLSALFIFFQLLSDHVRLEFYTFKSGNMPILTSGLTYLTRLIGVGFSSNISEFLIILIVSNVFPLFRFIRLLSLNLIGKLSFVKTTLMHFSLSKHMALSSGLNWGWNYLPIFFIGFYHDVVLAGILLSLRSLANIHYPLSTLLDTYVPSLLYKNKMQGSNKLISSTLIISMGLWALTLIILLFYSSEILEFAYGSFYKSFDHILIILWISSGILIFGKNKVLLARWLGRLSSESLSSAFALLFVVAIGIPLVEFYKLDGAIYVYLVATIIYTLTMVVNIHKN
jgi:O-antigen/teichoic acid export membrane protein